MALQELYKIPISILNNSILTYQSTIIFMFDNVYFHDFEIMFMLISLYVFNKMIKIKIKITT